MGRYVNSAVRIADVTRIVLAICALAAFGLSCAEAVRSCCLILTFDIINCIYTYLGT